MSTNAYQIHADGIAAVMDYLGDNCPQFTWNGQVIRMQPGSVKRGKELELGGFARVADLSFVVLVSELPAALAIEHQVTYLAVNYRIKTIETFSGDTLARIACVDPNKGA